MGATSGRRARDPAKVDAEAASDPDATAETPAPPDSHGLRLRPERRWAQLGAAGMASPPEISALGSNASPEAAPEDPPGLEDEASVLSRPVTQIAIGSSVGAAVVVMILAFNSRTFPTEGGPADSAVPAATVQAATSPAATGAVGGVTSLLETFDDLPISATPPPPWRVTGEGPVAVVALPTSVDRSVRIKSTAPGETTALCRPTDIGGATGLHVAFDYVLGGAIVDDVALVTLQTGGTGSIELLVGPTGAPVGVKGVDGGASASSPPAAPPSPPAGSAGFVWQRLVVDVDPLAGSVSWAGNDPSGAETGAGTATIEVAREAPGTLCLHSPAVPAGWIAIDDLTIEG